MDITRTSVLRHEAERALRKLPMKAAKRIRELLATTGTINEDTIRTIQHIITEELGAIPAHKFVNRYSLLFWKRGSEFALRQLKRAGLTIEIPSYLAVIDEETLTALRAMSLDLVKGLSEETKKAVTFQLREAMLQGEHPASQAMADRITAVTKQAQWKATRIARTESTRIWNEAAENRYKKGGVEKWKFVAIGDERTCSICNGLDGQIFSIGSQKPPIHVNCRCTIVPLIQK